ncbi:MAG TPA: hypothetical protein P5048_01490 [Chlamydiales bacterium]|nr:hypothetical protein [Chlamydiales bacterium]
MKNKWSFLLLFALFFSCASGTKVVTADDFAQIAIGMSEKKMIEIAGQPYSKKKLENGAIEYRYIERVTSSGTVLQERHYLVLVKDHKVISKKVLFYREPPYDINSYDMQTSENRNP